MALEHIGAKQAIGIGKETTKGTKVLPSYWIAKTGGAGLNPNVEFINEESGIGRIETVRDSRKVKNGSRLDIEGILTDQTTGMLILGVFGDVSTTEVEAGLVFDHDFSVDNTNNHTSFTIYQNDDVINDGSQSEYSTYMVMDSFEIEANAGDYGRFTLGMVGRGIGEDTQENSAYFEENKFSFDDVNIKVVSAADKTSAETALLSATPLKLNRCRISFGKNIMENQELGSVDIADIFNQNFTVEGDFDAVYRDRSNYDFMDNGLKYYMEIELKNTNVTIGSASNPTIKFLLNKVSFQSWNRTGDVNSIVTETFGFVGEFNETDEEMITCTLTNTVSSY